VRWRAAVRTLQNIVGTLPLCAPCSDSIRGHRIVRRLDNLTTEMPVMKLLEDRGTPLDRQRFTWRELSHKPISKLDDDAFTRVRIILMNGIEHEALRFQHAVARFNTDLRLPLAQIRQIEHHQETLVNWLIGADHSPLETTIGYEQTAIEVTAAMALRRHGPA
jgi:hypothetical protein